MGLMIILVILVVIMNVMVRKNIMMIMRTGMALDNFSDPNDFF